MNIEIEKIQRQAIAERLNELMVERKVSVKDISKKAGVCSTYISEIKGGSRNVSIILLFSIVKVFGMTFRDFFNEEYTEIYHRKFIDNNDIYDMKNTITVFNKIKLAFMLTNYRQYNKLKQHQLAEILSTNRNTISYLENGRLLALNSDLFKNIAGIFNISPKELSEILKKD